MNYTLDEIKKIQKKIKEDFDSNGASLNSDVYMDNILDFYKKHDKNRKKATQEKIKLIPYFHELISVFGKEATYKAIAQTSIDETKQCTQFIKKSLIIERCIKQRIKFLNYIKIKVILMGQNINDCIVYLYIDDQNYLVSTIDALINNDCEQIEEHTKSYYKNMNLNTKSDKILNNPITQLLLLQIQTA